MRRNPVLLVLCLCNGLFVLAEAMLVPIYALFAQNIGADVFLIGALAATLLVSRVVFTLVIRSVKDSSARELHFFLIGLLLRACAWGSLLLVSSLAGLFAVQVLLALGAALGSPAFSALFAQHLRNGRFMNAYADWEIVSALGAAIGAAVGGYVASFYGFETLFVAMALFALAAFAVLYRMRAYF